MKDKPSRFHLRLQVIYKDTYSAAGVDTSRSELDFMTGRLEAKSCIIKIEMESDGGKAMQGRTVSISSSLKGTGLLPR